MNKRRPDLATDVGAGAIPLRFLSAFAFLVASALPAHASDALALARLRADTRGALTTAFSPSTGTLRFARVDGDGALPAAKSGSPVERARGFAREHAALLGLADPDRELVLSRVLADELGWTHVSFEQSAGGVPVLAGVLRLHFDADGALRAVNGITVPTPRLVPPRLTARAAERAAGAAKGGAAVRAGGLVVYHDGLLRGLRGTARLAWDVDATVAGRRERVLVDAATGEVLVRLPRDREALRREVFDGGSGNDRLIWREGDALPFGGLGSSEHDGAVNRLIAATAATHILFLHLGAHDGWDGAGGTFRSHYRDPTIQCPNAIWRDGRARFCTGMVGDDIVAHEWTHGYTESTHDLLPLWQSGALAEAYSDIFGEAVDLMDTGGLDEPAPRRFDAGCSAYGRAPAPAVVIETPAAIAGDYSVGGATFGAGLDPERRARLAAPLDAADEEGPSPTDGCSEYGNPDEIAGRIALVDRGTCTFVVKAQRAQAAGAIGIVVANHENNALFTMGGEAPDVVIPAVLVARDDGAVMRERLGEGVVARLTLARPGERSVRWLVGEDTTGFDGAFRDLWNPGCFNHPTRPRDPRYVCGPGTLGNDYGGVHFNSGIASHAFALLVDGGTFAAFPVDAIGMVAALHVYWRAMAFYQVPATDFADHADALEQACDDLAVAGHELVDPRTGAPSGVVVTPATCLAVRTAVSAAGLREIVDRCGFQPLLSTSDPTLCGSGLAVPFFEDDLERGGDGWSETAHGVHAEWRPLAWQRTGRLPDGRDGHAFFAPNPARRGDCRPGSDDQSGVLTLDGPEVLVPDDAGQVFATFRHWVATEPEHDGGVLRLQVNGGAWQPLTSALRFNGYNGRLLASDNPLAGERAWTGSDDGTVQGSWGITQVDLGGLVRGGDRFRLRFELGSDGCAGRVGWYVDDLRALACVARPEPCVADDDTLCLMDGRFRVEVEWSNPGNGAAGRGIARPRSDLTGFFAFDDAANLELVVKMLELDGVVKLFYGQLTDLPFVLTVSDTRTGRVRSYRNGEGNCGAIDQAAFPKAATGSAPPPGISAADCGGGAGALCLLGGRVRVEVTWRNPWNGAAGSGTGSPLSDLAGLFTFGDERNVEIVAKALDFGDRILFLWGALSDLDYELVVTETASGATRRYANPSGRFCGGIEADTFP